MRRREPVKLQPLDHVDGKLFTHPSHVFYDARLVTYMVQHLLNLFRYDVMLRDSREMTTHVREEADGRTHRIIVIKPADLWQSKDVVAVGFFGQKQPGADPLPIQEVDTSLLQEMNECPGLLSYATLELTCGNYANCVLFVDEDSKNHWGRSRLHAYSAEILAPNYYHSIRLYNGHLPTGIHRPESIALTVVKYYDFQDTPYWTGWRSLSKDGQRHKPA